MKTRLFSATKKQLRTAEIVSALSFVLYVIGSAASLPEPVLAVGLVLFALFAVWTLAALCVYRADAADTEAQKRDASYNLIIGQGAVTVLLVACAALTIRGLLQ